MLALNEEQMLLLSRAIMHQWKERGINNHTLKL